MATTTKTEEQVFIGVGEEVIELLGDDKKEFLANRKAKQEAKTLLEAEYKAKQDARESAIKKLADIAGLTKEELASIL
jgi:hypothetical protein